MPRVPSTAITRTGHVLAVVDGRPIEPDSALHPFSWINREWDGPSFLTRRHPRRSPGRWPLRRRYPYDWAVQGL